MKRLLSIVIFAATSAFGTTITLQPGNQVEITPGDSTTVICSGSSQVYCTCDPDASYGGEDDLTLHRQVNGQDVKTILQTYSANSSGVSVDCSNNAFLSSGAFYSACNP